MDMKESFNFHRFDLSIPSFCCKCKICIVDEVLMKNVSAMTFLLNFFLCIILECNSDELKNDNSFIFPCWFQKSYLNTNTQLHIFIRGGIWLHSQLPSARVYGDYQLIIAISSSILVNNRTRSAAECHPF